MKKALSVLLALLFIKIVASPALAGPPGLILAECTTTQDWSPYVTFLTGTANTGTRIAIAMKKDATARRGFIYAGRNDSLRSNGCDYGTRVNSTGASISAKLYYGRATVKLTRLRNGTYRLMWSHPKRGTATAMLREQ